MALHHGLTEMCGDRLNPTLYTQQAGPNFAKNPKPLVLEEVLPLTQFKLMKPIT